MICAGGLLTEHADMIDKYTTDFAHILDTLLSDPDGECAEFKEARTGCSFDDLGRYFSALSNEAGIRSVPYAWLVLGIDAAGRPVGTEYRKKSGNLSDLRKEVRQYTSRHATFRGVYEAEYGGKRIVLLEIPAAVRVPVTWKGTGYIRDGGSVTEFTGL